MAPGHEAVVPSLRTRAEPREYDREMWKRRNGDERLFGRVKGFRRLFARFEKLDLVYPHSSSLHLLVNALRQR